MARAAAKRRQPVRHHDDKRRHKDSGGQRFEDTLFFNRLRKQAKWVFVFLALVFGLGFVVFGVGSSGVSGLSDIFSGIRGGGGGTSIQKAEKKAAANPKDATAQRDLATAYDQHGDIDKAIFAWTAYTKLKPKDVEGLTNLATDYQSQYNTQLDAARAAYIDASNSQASTFGPPADSPLGRALGNVEDPIQKQIVGSASQKASEAQQVLQATAAQLEGVYKQISTLQPNEPSGQLQLAQAAQQAGDNLTAITAYRRFIKLSPFDNQVAYAKQQIKTLESQLQGAPQG
jgi:hypothetical protein